MARIPELQKILVEKNLDGMLLLSPVSRFYATGLHSSAGALLITKNESYFVTDFRYIEAARAVVKDAEVVMSTKDLTPKLFVHEKVKQHKLKNLGFEASAMTVTDHESWSKALEKVTFTPVQDAVMALRGSKDEAEKAKIIAAQRIAEKALQEVLDGVIKVGMTEREVAAEIVYRILKYGGDGVSFAPIVVSGPNSSLPHGEPSDRKLQIGDFVTIDIGALKDGYCSDMTRTVAMGETTEEMTRVYSIVLKAQLAGIEAARAGVLGKEIDGTARAIIDAEGYKEYFGHGFGHGVGLEVHEAQSVGMLGETPIPEGAVITAEPGIYLPARFGVRIEDMLYVTKDGCENLTSMPKELLIIK